MQKTVIGISAINATDNPGSGYGVARSLQESQLASEISTIGISYDVNDPGNYLSDIFSNSFLAPYPSNGWEIMQNSISDIQQKSGLNLMIPCLDVELPLMIKNQQSLDKMGVKSLLPTQDQFELRSKDRLAELAKEIGCKYPKTRVVLDISQLIEVLKGDIVLPAVIKGKYYQAYIVHNQESAILKATEIAAKWGFPILVQERIEGQELNLIAISNQKGQLKGRVSIRKQLQTELGKIWSAITIHDERLNKICDNFVSLTKWIGPFELEFMVNQDGVYLIEINPRFPSWVYFATAVGINLPEMLVQIIKEQDCDQKLDYPLGKYFVRYAAEMVTDLTQFQNLISHQNRNGNS